MDNFERDNLIFSQENYSIDLDFPIYVCRYEITKTNLDNNNATLFFKKLSNTLKRLKIYCEFFNAYGEIIDGREEEIYGINEKPYEFTHEIPIPLDALSISTTLISFTGVNDYTYVKKDDNHKIVWFRHNEILSDDVKTHNDESSKTSFTVNDETVLTFNVFKSKAEYNLSNNTFKKAKYYATETSNLWGCCCGAINLKSNDKCVCCNNSKKEVFELTSQKNIRKVIENVYNNCNKIFPLTNKTKSNDIKKAVTNLTLLDDYKDSKTKLDQCKKQLLKNKKKGFTFGLIGGTIAIVVALLFILPVMFPIYHATTNNTNNPQRTSAVIDVESDDLYETLNTLESQGITELSFKEGTTVIPNDIFNGRKFITKITIPNTVTEIGENAFMRTSITQIVIPDSVKIIGYRAFSDCHKLKSVTLGSSVTTIEDYAFNNCYKLQSITIPDSVTTIGKNAFEYCDELSSVTLSQNVTEIADYQFKDCKNLTSIIIPNGVTTLGENAFEHCSKLTEVTLPNTLTTIYSGCFNYCSSLLSINIPNLVNEIPRGTFVDCYSLMSVTIGSSVTSIAQSAFDGCAKIVEVINNSSLNMSPSDSSLYGRLVSHAIVISNRDPLYQTSKLVTDENGFVTLNHTEITLVNYLGSSAEIVIPSNVYSINNSALRDNATLSKVVIHSGVNNVETYAFANCTSLKEVIVQGSTNIDPEAFIYCELETLSAPYTSMIFLGQQNVSNLIITNTDSITNLFSNNPYIKTVTLTSSVATIGAQAFRNCSSLTSVDIPNTVTSIGEYAFSNCPSLTSIIIPSSVASIGNSAFSSCSLLTSVNIKNGVASIGNNAFWHCPSLTSIEIPDSVSSIGSSAFSLCSSLTSVTVGNGISSIGADAFYNCTSLSSIAVGNGVTSIGSGAFTNCPIQNASIPTNAISSISKNHLKTVVITSGESISNNAFSNCATLTSLTIKNGVASIGDYAFEKCTSLSYIDIEDGLSSIGTYAFNNCKKLTSITIPNSVTSIGNFAFYYCTSLTIYCEAESAPSGWGEDWNYPSRPVVWDCNNNEIASDDCIYTSINGINYSLKGEEASVVGQPIDITVANIPSTVTYKNVSYNVTSISGQAFDGCTSLASVTIGNNVKSIGFRAFYDCTSLTSVKINNNVTTIDGEVFGYCDSLTIYCEVGSKQLNWSNTWNYSDCPIVWNCNNNDVADDEYIYTVINGMRFGIKDGVATVAKQPTNLQVVTIPSTITYENTSYKVTSIGNNAFSERSITSVIIGDNVTSIGNSAFYQCDLLTSVTMGKNVTSIGDHAFYQCDLLTNVEIPNSVISIGKYAFQDCTSLTSVTMGKNVTTIGNSAFGDCYALTSIIIPNSVTSIDIYAFTDCDSLTIYCEATSQPSGWNTNWNFSARPVYWYSETSPTTEGNYWYYDQNNNVVTW